MASKSLARRRFRLIQAKKRSTTQRLGRTTTTSMTIEVAWLTRSARSPLSAKAAGARKIEDRSIKAGPVQALVDLAEEVGADLLVIGNVGLDARSAIVGRVFSIPGAVASRAKIDVLIVHTTR